MEKYLVIVTRFHTSFHNSIEYHLFSEIKKAISFIEKMNMDTDAMCELQPIYEN